MSISSPRAVFKVLQTSPDALARLLAHSRALLRADAELKRALDEPLASHCRVANLRPDTLVLQVDSPAWGARLRYQLPALLTALRGVPRFAHLQRIELKTRPIEEPPAALPPVRRALSASAAAVLASAADALPDAELSAALRRLASHGRDESD